MGNKENMRQAMKELLGFAGAEEKEETVDLDVTRQEVADTVDKGFFRSAGAKAAPDVEDFTPLSQDAAASEDMPGQVPFIRPGATIISAGASLFGDIRAEGDVEVLGKLKGNLEATGNVRITGKVLGDVKGESVLLHGCAVQGNVTAIAAVAMDESAIVVGDILATDFESNGKVKGSLQIARSAVFKNKAVLAGNVSAGTVTMSQGARIQGAIRIAEDAETNSLFGEGLEI